MGRAMKKLLGGGGAVFAAIIAYNAFVAIPVAQALSDESGVTMVAYRRWLPA